MSRRGIQVLWSVVLVAAAMAVGACSPGVAVRVDPGGPGAGRDDAARARLAEAWRDPATWPARFGRVRSDPASLGLVESMPGPILAMRQGDAQRREVEREMLEDIAKLMSVRGRGWFRGSSSLTIKGEGTGSFVFTADRSADPDRVKGPTEPALYFKFISGSRAGAGDTVRMQRTWFAYYDPVGMGPFDHAPARPCGGVVVVVPGMFGTPGNIVSQTVHALRARGYAVLRMLSHPSRFTEQGTFAIGSEADVEAVAAQIARTLGDRAAECAYAVEEVHGALLRARPALVGVPRIALGMSGGAMVLPTIVARNPDAYHAAVLIAGGADFLSVALESNYAAWIDALRFRRDDGTPLDAATAGRLIVAYRESAPLDSLYTAAALRGKPLLLLHATGDQAVPAHLGDLLWDRLDRPIRWSFDTGHEALFLFLPLQIPRIADWLEAQVPPIPPAPTAGVPAAAPAPGA